MIEINNWSDQTRVHVYAQQFLPNYADTLRDELENAVKSNIEMTNFPFAIWKNMFESNNTIGDEIRYVFDRQKKENKMGNTLDRPTLLMQKQFVQHTTTNEEKIKAGTQYAKKDLGSEIQAKAG